MGNKHVFVETQLVCMNCGNIVTIQRRISRLKNVGHVKHLFCYKCDSVQKHYEVREVSTFLWKYSRRDVLQMDDNTRLVFEFLMKREENYEKMGRIHKKILTKE